VCYVSNRYRYRAIKDLHLFSFKTPTLWAVMSGEGVAYCASSMRNGVKRAVLNLQWCNINIKTFCFFLTENDSEAR